MTDSTRRQFLSAAAALTALPAATAAESGGDAEAHLVECDICGADQASAYVDHTSVATALESATVCRGCQFVQNHSLPADVCDRCGDPVDGAGYSIELEYAMGESNIPARLSGTLCSDCSGWVGFDINYDGVESDDAADRELLELVNEMATAANELREDDS